MTITEKLDAFIKNEGNGNVRDALNIALARLDQKQLIIESRELEIDGLKRIIENLETELEFMKGC